jgi:hypothetical protein
MVEDCLQCDFNETLMLLIFPKRPFFGWLAELSIGHLHGLSHFCDAFPRWRCLLVKHLVHELLMAGGYSAMTFLELFSFFGGYSLALCFVLAAIDGFELNFADIFYSNQSIQIWGIQKDTHDLKGQLKKMKNGPGRRSSMFQRYLLELYSDCTSTK